MTKQLTNEGVYEGYFVEHSIGNMEGTHYSSVHVSDGIAPVKIQAKHLTEELNFQRGQLVTVRYHIIAKKNRDPEMRLLEITPNEKT